MNADPYIMAARGLVVVFWLLVGFLIVSGIACVIGNHLDKRARRRELEGRDL